jgi:hypothetical protein
MPNDKAQMSSQAQNPKAKNGSLAFSLPAEHLPARAWQAGHLDFNCHSEFEIRPLNFDSV